MKAWLVRDKHEFCAEVVFAETRGKARSLALSTDCCEDANFTDIEVRREPDADKYYKEGKWHLDWDDPKDRIALVKECGFSCDCDVFCYELCQTCPANRYCDRYADFKKEEALVMSANELCICRKMDGKEHKNGNA